MTSRGPGRNQQDDEATITPTDDERFQTLANQWEHDTILMSSTHQAIKHPAYRAILEMGQTAVPLILKRIQSQGGHWFHTLHQLTHANPVPPADRGKITAMKQAWLQWGTENGYTLRQPEKNAEPHEHDDA